MFKFAITLVLLLPFFQGCAHDVMTYRHSSVGGAGANANSIVNGLGYTLPKTVLEVTIPYTVIVRKKFRNGIEDVAARKTDSVQITKPIKIVPKLVGDNNFIFVASGMEVTNNIFLESDLTLSWNSEGLLNGAGLETTDKTVDTAKSLVSAGVQVAAMMAIAGAPEEQVPEGILKIRDQISLIYKQIGGLATAIEKDKTATLAELRKRLDYLHGVLEDYQSKNKEVEERSEIEYTEMIDPADFTKDASMTGYISYTIKPGGLIKGVAAAGMPVVKIGLRVSDAQIVDSLKHNIATNKGVEGIVYRMPAATEVRVWNNGNEALRQVINFPQFGAYGVARFASKATGSRTTKLSFSEDSGGLKEYGVKSSSSADKAAAALDESLGKIKEAVTNYKYDSKLTKLDYEYKLKQAKDKLKEENAEPTKDLKQQKDMVEAENDLIKAQIELEKAKNELARLKNGEASSQ